MILASSDTDSNVGCMVTIGLAVWLSMQSSPVIKLYHAHSYECLLEINVSPTVTKVLAGQQEKRIEKLAMRNFQFELGSL